MTDIARARRLAVRIREIVAETLDRQVKDPRLGMVTITGSKVTPDLREATLYYTVLGTDLEQAESAAALESAKGVLRSTVGKKTGIRYTPSLAFESDAIPEQVRSIDILLAQARAADEEVAKVREGKTHAGDENPYVTDDVAISDDVHTEELDDADALNAANKPDVQAQS